MTKNRFYIYKQEIKKISEERNVEVSVAARMLAHEKGWENYHAELNDWDQRCIRYMKHETKTLADLFEA